MEKHKNSMKHSFTISMLKSVLVIAIMVLFGSMSTILAQTPPAGTLIGNQATATFEDLGGNTRTVISNVVNTQVTQIASLSYTSTQSKTVSPGGQLSFPHTITNNGNGTDQFTIGTAQSGDFAFSSINVYADANGDGVPDDFTAITQTPNIAAGGSFNIVIVVNVPASALNTQTATVTSTVTSNFNNAVDAILNDVATVTDNAVINVTKSMSNSSGNPGSGPHKITLTYTNSGNATATALELTDVLPTGMNYVAGTGRWS